MNIKVLFTRMVSSNVGLDLLVDVIYENVFIRILSVHEFLTRRLKQSRQVRSSPVDFQVLTIFGIKKCLLSKFFYCECSINVNLSRSSRKYNVFMLV